MAEVAAQFDSAAYQLGPNRLTRLDPIDPSDQRTTVRPAPGAQDFGSHVLPLPVPAIVPAFAAPPTSGPDGRFYDSTHFRPDATQFATTNGGIQPPSTVEPSQPRRRGLLALLIATGAILAVCIGLIIGLVTSDRSAASPSADAAGPVATASTVASSSDAPATTPAPATSAPATAVPETAVPVAQTLPLAVVPETAAPPTIPPQTLPEVPPTAVAVSQPLPGDLFVSRPMTKPACDGSYVTMVGSSVLPDQYARVVQANLDAYPTSQYLLTETTCPSLSPRTSQGNLIYSIYLGPFGTKAEACAARSMGPADAYIRILDTTTPATAQQLCG
jgi:serine/threonine-protein kinase